MIKPRKKFMQMAIREAEKARRAGDYAIGAVIVNSDKVIACSRNRCKTDENPISHAESLAIIKACKIKKQRHLKNCVLYTTHEPCSMCASLVVWAKLKGVVYGSRYQDMKNYRRKHANGNYLWRTIDMPCKKIFEKSTEKIVIIKDFMRKECIELFHNK